MAIALHHSRANGSAKLILIGIANHDGDGGAWPSQATLGKYAGGLSRSRVKAATDRLVELGEITIQKNAGGAPGLLDWERPHLYRFMLRCPEWCDRTPQHRDRRKHLLRFEASSEAIPEGGTYIPGEVSDANPGEVPPLRQEPPLNQKTHREKTSHSTRACANGHPEVVETPGYCKYGDPIRTLQAVTS